MIGRTFYHIFIPYKTPFSLCSIIVYNYVKHIQPVKAYTWMYAHQFEHYKENDIKRK